MPRQANANDPVAGYVLGTAILVVSTIVLSGVICLIYRRGTKWMRQHHSWNRLEPQSAQHEWLDEVLQAQLDLEQGHQAEPEPLSAEPAQMPHHHVDELVDVPLHGPAPRHAPPHHQEGRPLSWPHARAPWHHGVELTDAGPVAGSPLYDQKPSYARLLPLQPPRQPPPAYGSWGRLFARGSLRGYPRQDTEPWLDAPGPAGRRRPLLAGPRDVLDMV